MKDTKEDYEKDVVNKSAKQSKLLYIYINSKTDSKDCIAIKKEKKWNKGHTNEIIQNWF